MYSFLSHLSSLTIKPGTPKYGTEQIKTQNTGRTVEQPNTGGTIGIPCNSSKAEQKWKKRKNKTIPRNIQL